ncbi:MAG: tetratricopeptide repeat protein, partial [Polyangia bacterium]
MCTTSLVLLTILAQATPLTPDPQAKAQAQELLSQGSKLYGQGDVIGALEKFQAAYAAFPSPKLMFNIAQAERELGRPVEAMEAFEKFLEGATDASPDKIADARKSVAQFQKSLGRILVECGTSGVEVSVDGGRVGVTPLPGPIWATPGIHQVAARHAGEAPAIEAVEMK